MSMKMHIMTGYVNGSVNTDKEIWRQIPDDYYSPSIHVTEQNSIGINVGGTVYVKTIEEWHRLAKSIEPLHQIIENQND